MKSTPFLFIALSLMLNVYFNNVFLWVAFRYLMRRLQKIVDVFLCLTNGFEFTFYIFTPLKQALADIYEAPWEDKKTIKSAPTGIKKLDEVTGGFQEGEVTILAARPSMGKTDVMLHFAKITGWAGFLPIVFSLEMPQKLITPRLIASTGGFNRLKMRDPKVELNQKQKDKWAYVIGNLAETNIQLFDRAGQTVAEMKAKTRKMMHQFPDKKPFIFIDYLTLIHSSQPYGGNSHL